MGGRASASGFGNLDRAEAVAIDPAGRVVVAGHSMPPSGVSGSALLARFTESGPIDGTFGAGGFIRVDYRSPAGDDDAAALDIDDRGRYVIAGRSFDGETHQIGVARFTVDYPGCAAVRADRPATAGSSAVPGPSC